MTDRLSALLQRFELRAQVFHGGVLRGALSGAPGTGVGHLHLVRRGPLRVTLPSGQIHTVEEPSVLLLPRSQGCLVEGGDETTELVCATVDFGAGDENPLWRHLPPLLCVPLSQVPGLDLAQQLLFSEALGSRCGRHAVADRLAEVLVVQLLRHALSQHLVDAGVMAGLSDPRLARTLSAVHADPAQAWSLDTMAATAGMSRARFAAHFNQTVGVPPGDYLTGWRMGVARHLLRKGFAVKQVASQVGYASPGAFGRVFQKRVGATPSQWQQVDAGQRQAQAS